MTQQVKSLCFPLSQQEVGPLLKTYSTPVHKEERAFEIPVQTGSSSAYTELCTSPSAWALWPCKPFAAVLTFGGGLWLLPAHSPNPKSVGTSEWRENWGSALETYATMSTQTVNLDTYSLSLLTAKEDILNPRSSTNW